MISICHLVVRSPAMVATPVLTPEKGCNVQPCVCVCVCVRAWVHPTSFKQNILLEKELTSYAKAKLLTVLHSFPGSFCVNGRSQTQCLYIYINIYIYILLKEALIRVDSCSYMFISTTVIIVSCNRKHSIIFHSRFIKMVDNQ